MAFTAKDNRVNRPRPRVSRHLRDVCSDIEKSAERSLLTGCHPADKERDYARLPNEIGRIIQMADTTIL